MVVSLLGIRSWHTATQCVVCCGMLHGPVVSCCSMSCCGTVRRSGRLLDVHATATLLHAQPGKQKKKRLTMVCSHSSCCVMSYRVMVWHGTASVCSMCAPQPHCCMYNLVSEKKKKGKRKK